MEVLVQSINALLPTSVDVVALAILLIFVPLFVALSWRAKGGRRMALRPIPAYRRLQALVSQGAESGTPVHVALGVGRLGTDATLESLMGLTVFDYVARRAAAANQPALGTVGDATILPAAQTVLQQAREEAGHAERFRGHEVQFYGPEPLAYAAGAYAAVARHRPRGSALLGRFGPEGLWLAESAAGLGMPRLGGATDPSSAALLAVSVDHPLIGEEVFAAGAYLHRPSHLGSLATQDIFRLVAVLSIILGVILTSLGYWR
ncbi:MAG TPA: hypothetical protein GX714_09355 [Chloroflexi bacterium]|jgi:hypothetical protein|nr:hypothetical protein [Chloroflexota bacterium]